MVIEEQLVNLKNKAFEIVDNIYNNEYLHSIPVKFKKFLVPIIIITLLKIMKFYQ